SLFFFLLATSFIFSGGCKGSSTEPENHVNIGDSIPNRHSQFFYLRSNLDFSGNSIPGTSLKGNAIVDTTGISIFGKDRVYFILDDADSCYYSYEANSDVSMYLENTG